MPILGVVAGNNPPPAVISNISFVTSTHSSSLISTIAIPASAQANDIAVLMTMGANAAKGAAPAAPTNTGWTNLNSWIFNANSPDLRPFRIHTAYKILTSGDLGTSINTVTSSEEPRHTISIFRPNVAPSSIQLLGSGYDYRASVQASATASASGNSGVGLVLASIGTANTTTKTVTGATMTDMISPAATNRFHQYSIVSGSFSNVTITADSSGAYRFVDVGVLKVL